MVAVTIVIERPATMEAVVIKQQQVMGLRIDGVRRYRPQVVRRNIMAVMVAHMRVEVKKSFSNIMFMIYMHLFHDVLYHYSL
jgi:hypothetical protein